MSLIARTRKPVKKTTYRKMVKRRRAKRANLRMTIPFGLPESIITKLTYSDNYALNGGGAGLVNTQIWRGNDITDCDFTGIGHQAFMNDTFASLYGYSCVFASKIELHVASGDPNLAAQKIYLRPAVASTAPSDPDLEEERKYSKVVFLPTGGANVKYMQSYATTAKMHGVTKKHVLEEDNYRSSTNGTSTSLPALQWFWKLSAFCMSSSQGADIYINVKITYQVLYTRRLIQTQS